MKLKRFLSYFTRVQSSDPDETTIHFKVGDQEYLILITEFDTTNNEWTVKLTQKDTE